MASGPFTGTFIGAFSPGGRRGEPALTLEARVACDGDLLEIDLFHLAEPRVAGQSPRTRLTRPLRCPVESVRPLVDWLLATLAPALDEASAPAPPRPLD